MRYWIRELAGWLLVLIGLAAFGLVILMCLNNRVVTVWPVVLVAIFVFRGGIHLLKVAVAARVCQQAQDRLYPEHPKPERRSPKRTAAGTRSGLV